MQPHERISIGHRFNDQGFVATIEIDGAEYKAFRSYEIAAMVRHAMLDACAVIAMD